MSKTNHEENKILDVLYRGQSITVDGKVLSWSTVPNWYFGLLVADKIRSEEDSLPVALNDTVWVVGAKGLRLYKVTTAGNLAASQPVYPGVNDEAIADGTAVLTEQYTAMESGAGFIEPSSSDYARVQVLSSLTNFTSTQGDTAVSNGVDGTIENNIAITFPNASTQAYGKAGAFAYYDAAVAGFGWRYGYLGSPVDIGLGATGISFAAGQLSIQEDS